PPAVLRSSVWGSVAASVSPDRIRMVVPSLTDPATIYACTGAARSIGGASSVPIELYGPIEIWRTRDTGHTWSRLAFPADARGVTCDLTIAPDAPDRLAVTVLLTEALRASLCPAETLYLSTDAGATCHVVSSEGLGPA